MLNYVNCCFKEDKMMIMEGNWVEMKKAFNIGFYLWKNGILSKKALWWRGKAIIIVNELSNCYTKGLYCRNCDSLECSLKREEEEHRRNKTMNFMIKVWFRNKSKIK